MPKTQPKPKDIHHHIGTLSRLNTILAMFGLAAVLVLVVWLKWSGGADSSLVDTVNTNTSMRTGDAAAGVPDEPVDQGALTDDYQVALNDILEGYTFADAATAADLSAQLLDLTLPTSYRTVQLETIIALEEVTQGNTSAAQERIRALQDEYSWYLPDTSL